MNCLISKSCLTWSPHPPSSKISPLYLQRRSDHHINNWMLQEGIIHPQPCFEARLFSPQKWMGKRLVTGICTLNKHIACFPHVQEGRRLQSRWYIPQGHSPFSQKLFITFRFTLDSKRISHSYTKERFTSSKPCSLASTLHPEFSPKSSQSLSNSFTHATYQVINQHRLAPMEPV